jgi:stearoyl-CoA desaturase (delta-9 desaturase)
MDYRNAIVWYQYDPTKWFIYGMYKLGFASQLKSFPANEVKSGCPSLFALVLCI